MRKGEFSLLFSCLVIKYLYNLLETLFPCENSTPEKLIKNHKCKMELLNHLSYEKFSKHSVISTQKATRLSVFSLIVVRLIKIKQQAKCFVNKLDLSSRGFCWRCLEKNGERFQGLVWKFIQITFCFYFIFSENVRRYWDFVYKYSLTLSLKLIPKFQILHQASQQTK